MTTTAIAIPFDEWVMASSLLSLSTHDERNRFSLLRLVSDGSVRRWMATDSFCAAVLDGGADAHVYDVGVSQSLFAFVPVACGTTETADLVVDRSGEQHRIGVSGVGGSMFVDEGVRGYPDFEAFFDPDMALLGRVRLRASRLLELLQARRARIEPEEDDDLSIGSPPYWLEIGEGVLSAYVDWSHAGPTEYRIPVDHAEGDGALTVNPASLHQLAELFEPDDLLELQIPVSSGDPVRVFGTGRKALLMPVRSPEGVMRLQVEDVIAKVAGHLSVERDHDGDYALHRRQAQVFGRLEVDHAPPTLQVFAVVLDEVDSSPELLAELNDLNTEVGFARLFLVERQVLAEVDLVAATLDENELGTAIDRIVDVAHRITPMLAAVFGGTSLADPESARWSYYRSTVIDAELSPGQMVTLTGPDAADPWPFPGPVHVLTGWNPQGLLLELERNQDVNRRIANDVLELGGRFVFGRERSVDGSHSEECLVAWGLDRDGALGIGRRAEQDAIFEIDGEQVTLVACFDDRVQVWPRTAPVDAADGDSDDS